MIALFFACHTLQDTKGINLTKGEVVIFKIPNSSIKYYDSDTVSLLSNIAKMKNDFSFRSKSNKEEFCKQQHIKLLRHEVGMEKPHFQPQIDYKDLKSVICVKAKRNNPRIQNQSGAFLLFGVNNDNKKMAPLDKTWLHDKDHFKICNQNGLLKELASLGIDGSFVYPEMQNYAKILKGNAFRNQKTHV